MPQFKRHNKNFLYDITYTDNGFDFELKPLQCILNILVILALTVLSPIL